MNDNSFLNDTEEKVWRLIELKRYDHAEMLIGIALKNNPYHINLLYYSAYIHSENKRYKEAETTLVEVLELDPENKQALFLLATVYTAINKYVEAERLVIELIRQNPEASDLYALYASIMLETLHIEKADKLAKEAIRLEPDNIFGLLVSVLCGVIKSNKPEYQHRLSEIVRNYPESHTTLEMVLTVLLEQKKFRESLRIAKELVRSDPADESTAAIIKKLRVVTHPTMIPLMPLNKYGWHASALMWVAILIICYAASDYPVITYGWLLYVLYSWVYPSILKKIIN